MNIQEEALNYHRELYHLPANEKDIEEFARLVLNAFIAELEANTKSITWNYGFDTVIFDETLQKVKKEFLDGKNNGSICSQNRSDEGNTDVPIRE